MRITGCPQVRDIFDTPLFSGRCWCMAKPFDVLNGESLRFFLMYKTLCFINLAPPKIMVQNIVNISYIHSSKPWSKPGLANVVADCSAPCGPHSVKISCGKQARVWQQMIGISLMCVDLRRRSGWKTVKNWWFSLFLTRIALPPVGRSGWNFTWWTG